MIIIGVPAPHYAPGPPGPLASVHLTPGHRPLISIGPQVPGPCRVITSIILITQIKIFLPLFLTVLYRYLPSGLINFNQLYTILSQFE